MHTIIHKQIIAQDIKRLDVLAPAIAGRALPGHFVMLTPLLGVKSFPLTIVDTDDRKGTLSLIVHEVGAATKLFGGMSIGQDVAQVLGPLGQPAMVQQYGTVICIATGIGAAQILPICKALKKRGNRVIGIIGAKSKKVLMLESQMRVVCDDLFITTNDGSYERKGLATEVLKELLAKHKVHAVYAIGSVEMMGAASAMARPMAIPVRITANTLMVNGLGTCGSCRIRVGNQFRLACVEGPEFNGYDVDFEDLQRRDDAMKEKTWQGQNRPSSPKSAALPTFMKSFWGLARNKT